MEIVQFNILRKSIVIIKKNGKKPLVVIDAEYFIKTFQN